MKKQQDERVVAERRKIGSETCQLLMFALVGSILVKQFAYAAPFSQYAVEFICVMGASVYILIRNFLSGNNLFDSKRDSKIMLVVKSMIIALAVAAINGVYRYIEYEEHFTDEIGLFILTLAITFVSAFVVTFTVLFALYLINKKRQEKIEANFIDDDNE